MCGWEGRGAVLGWGVREASLRRVARGQPPEIKGEKQEQKAVKQIRTDDQAGPWQRREAVCELARAVTPEYQSQGDFSWRHLLLTLGKLKA